MPGKIWRIAFVTFTWRHRIFFANTLLPFWSCIAFFYVILYYSELNVTAMRRAKSWSLSVIYIQWQGRSTNGSAGSESPCDCRGPKKNWSQLVSWPHSMLCTMLHAGCCICKCDISWTLSLGACATATGHNSGSRDGKGAQSISSQGMMHPALQSSFQNLGVQLSKLLAGPCIGGRAGARSCSAGGDMVRDSTRWPGMPHTSPIFLGRWKRVSFKIIWVHSMLLWIFENL